jgi:hypothetical protein
MNPEVKLIEEGEDGELYPYTPKMTAMQEYLWECFSEDIDNLKAFAGDDDLVIVHAGDLTQGQKYWEHQVSTRLADQIVIAAANMEPLMELPNEKVVRFAKGTGSHVFGEGSSEILVARELRIEYGADVAVTYHGLLAVQTGQDTSITVDYSHHGPFHGSRKWLRGNSARFYLRDLMFQEIMAGRRPPDLVVRGHYHVPVTERLDVRANGTKHTSRLLVLPSYCGLGDHAHRVTRSTHIISNGMFAYEAIDGKLSEPEEFVHVKDIRTKETV